MKRYLVDKSALEHNIKLLLEKAKGKTLKDMSLAEMEELWQEAKKIH